jgi:coenzyme F420-0:L-glutamate ligase/coenzyme F420-1:gamma-L-glutamate ligase
MNIELQNFLRSRRSIRRYKPIPILKDIIERILSTAIHAPSAKNNQPWRFVIVVNPVIKKKLAEAITGGIQVNMLAEGVSKVDIHSRVERINRRTNEAPLLVVLCHEVNISTPHTDPIRQNAENIMAIQYLAMTGLQLPLSAQAEGLGGIWLCWLLFGPEETKQALDLPGNSYPLVFQMKFRTKKK